LSADSLQKRQAKRKQTKLQASMEVTEDEDDILMQTDPEERQVRESEPL